MNDAPTGAATIAAKNGTEDNPLSFTVAELTAGVDDVDAGDSLTVSAVGTPANGSATLNATDGSITYRPNADFSGTDSFTFTLVDSGAAPLQRTATVNIGA